MSPASPKPFIIPVFIPHSGCPHRCVFCNQEAITGIKRRLPTLKTLHADIERYARYKGRRRSFSQVAFYGGNFLGLDPEQIRFLLEAAQSFVKRGTIDGIRFSTRPDTVTEDRLDLLRAFSVHTVELGAQSMDDRVLARVRRGHCAGNTEQAVSRLKKRRYAVGLQLMVGLPGEGRASCMTTAKKAADLNPDLVRIYPTLVLKNSLLAGWYHDRTYRPLSLDEAVWRSKRMYRLFAQRNIPVVRMGLQQTNEMAPGEVILAGPHHPAFGELVYSAIFFDKAARVIRNMDPLPEKIELRVHPKNESRMRGCRNRNLEKLTEVFGAKTIRVLPDPGCPEGSIRIE